ncbi:hypothetical protein HDU83_000427 [Entophlyctis luteolus]|nr:hypothetical protein HDU83_000427 [Entophlyctis luteolus]
MNDNASSPHVAVVAPVIADAIEQILRGSDMSTVSSRAVRTALSERGGGDTELRDALAVIDPAGLKAAIAEIFDRVSESLRADDDGGKAPPSQSSVKQEADDEIYARALQTRENDAAAVSSRHKTRSAGSSAQQSQPRKAKRSAGEAPVKRRGGGGFSKPLVLSSALSALIRVASAEDEEQRDPETKTATDASPNCTNAPLLETPKRDDTADVNMVLPRHEVVRLLWVHIKRNSLQVQSDKRKIECDALMVPVFKKKRIDMFTMNKLLVPHLKEAGHVVGSSEISVPNVSSKKSTDLSSAVIDSGDEDDESSEEDDEESEDDDSENSSRNSDKTESGGTSVVKSRKRRNLDLDEEQIPKRKRRNAGNGGWGGKLRLSEPLAEVLGTTEEMPRHEVVKQIWAYIKANNLQDPSDKRFILCDEKLERLFGVDRVSMFGMNKLLTNHLEK